MSKKEKLIKKIKNNPHNIRFEELMNLLLSYGFLMIMKGTSHAVFKKEGYKTFTIVKPHGKKETAINSRFKKTIFNHRSRN